MENSKIYLKEKGFDADDVVFNTNHGSVRLFKLMQAYADQQIRIAVEKALEIASEEAKIVSVEIFNRDFIKKIDKQSILSLTDKVINELNK